MLEHVQIIKDHDKAKFAVIAFEEYVHLTCIIHKYSDKRSVFQINNKLSYPCF